jgi:hypothetical protein
MPNPNQDVYYAYDVLDKAAHNMIIYILDKLACIKKDYFVPMYHNIIDPNLYTTKQEHDDVWVATDFIIDEIKISKLSTIVTLQLSILKKAKGKKLNRRIIKIVTEFLKSKTLGKASIAGPISDLDQLKFRELYVAVEMILTAALPKLAELRRPALILPGKIQAVIKAQRIYLKPGEEYAGIWHYDGKNEDIVAVVIYYYRHSDGLCGGDLEFLDKKQIRDEFWVSGDCDPEDFTKEDVENYINESRCRVPVKPGTLVVFSNYQNIHRVLRTICPKESEGDPKSPDGNSSRDFLLFFIVDQKKELKNTRDIKFNSCEENFKLRKTLFEAQIEPVGKFGPHNDLIYSTGNGYVAQIGLTTEDEDIKDYFECNHRGYKREGLKYLKHFILEPPLGRGLSWVFDNQDIEDLYEEI